MKLQFDLGTASNYQDADTSEYFNAVSAIDAVIASGSVVDVDNATATGVAFSLSASPFQGIGGATDGGADPFPSDIAATAAGRPMTMNASFASAEAVISGLPDGDYVVTVFGARNLNNDYPATVSVNGQSGVNYNADNAGDYAAHTATDTVTISGGADLDVNISHTTGVGKYAYANLITIETSTAPAITNIDGDNEVAQGQTSVTIACNNTPASVSSWDADIGGDSLTPVSWNSGNPIVDIPGGTTLTGSATLTVNYTE